MNNLASLQALPLCLSTAEKLYGEEEEEEEEVYGEPRPNDMLLALGAAMLMSWQGVGDSYHCGPVEWPCCV